MSQGIFSGSFLSFILGGFIFFILTCPLHAQNPKDIQNILKATKGAELKRLATALRKTSEIKHAQALQQAAKRGWWVRQAWDDGTCAEISELGRNGIPVYHSTANLNSAITVSTNKLWNGGVAGLNLSGSGITLREWDVNGVRLTHRELAGRVTQGDVGTSVSLHSTHVAGTMLASGIVNSAHGMANQALLRAFDWNDDYAEMAAEAADGALLSNSSYVYISGWYLYGTTWYWYGDSSISPVEDFEFGFYSPYAATVDSITFLAPYYLPCEAAGNDRTAGPAVQPVSHYVYIGNDWVLSNDIRNLDGMPSGYDCISYGWGVSKNILTVGAVYHIPNGYSSPSNVVLVYFSGTGPTDDGRIKPDLVADGSGLYSTGAAHDSNYQTMSGTSMATPSITGSLALLQEHYHNLHGDYLRSATLKGIAIHTADEAGSNPGPDYMYGWGLLNTAKAASVISNTNTALVRETTLMDGTTFSMNIRSNGTEPLRATICWTDPPGIPPPNALNPPTIMLINDLDLRIDGNTYKPWVLDPANPASAASKGDNFRDNIEHIFIPNPGAGCHTLTVNHKGVLSGGLQAFSLILSGISSYPDFVQGSISGNQTICQNNVPAMLTGVVPTGGSGPYSYQWQSSFDSLTFTSIDEATGINYQPGPMTATTYFRQIQRAQTSCDSATTNIIKIQVNSQFVPTITGPLSACSGTEGNVYTTEPGMTSYVWNVTGGTITEGGTSSNNFATITWDSPGEQAIEVGYTGSNSCIASMPIPLGITVHPTPAIPGAISGPTNVIPGQTGVNYSVSLLSGATGYAWTTPPGAIITYGSNTNSIVVTFPSSDTSGIISVHGTNTFCDGGGSSLYVGIGNRRLNLASVLLEGLYNGAGMMRKACDEYGEHFGGDTADVIGVELHKASDYSMIEYAGNGIGLSTSGFVTLTIPRIYHELHYITVKHRNSIGVTSASPVDFSAPAISYLFDTPEKSFGNNMGLMIDGTAVIFAADVNQDGIVDGTDLSDIGNLADIAASGFLAEDLNGDGLVDGSDLSVSGNNAAEAVGEMTP